MIVMDQWTDGRMDQRSKWQRDLHSLSISLLVYLPINLSVSLSVCLSVCLSVSLSVGMSLSFSVCLPVKMFVCLSKCLSACQNVCLPVKCLSVCLSIYLLACLSCSVLTRLHPALLRSEIIRRSLLRLPVAFGTSTIQIYAQERSWNVPALCWLLRRTSYLK